MLTIVGYYHIISWCLAGSPCHLRYLTRVLLFSQVDFSTFPLGKVVKSYGSQVAWPLATRLESVPEGGMEPLVGRNDESPAHLFQSIIFLNIFEKKFKKNIDIILFIRYITGKEINMKYQFLFSTKENGDKWHEIDSPTLKDALCFLAEYLLRNYPDVNYLGTSYYVFDETGKTSSRKLKASAKDFFWTFFHIQRKMEAHFQEMRGL